MRSAASDLGLHCLPMSLLWDARLKWVNFFSFLNEEASGEMRPHDRHRVFLLVSLMGYVLCPLALPGYLLHYFVIYQFISITLF